MSKTLEAVALLREHRNRLHFDEKLAYAAVEEEGVPSWTADALRMHTEMAEHILGLLVPGEGAGEDTP